MIKIIHYKSITYPTYPHALRVAKRLSEVDGNKYVVYPCTRGFFFSNIAPTDLPKRSVTHPLSGVH